MKRKFWIVLCLILIVLILLGTSSWYFSKYSLTTSYYEIFTEKLEKTLRIVQLSDLHNSVFGKDNEKLVHKVAEQSPDLIVLTGDMLNGNEKEISIAKQLIVELSKIAPVYASYGNHEKDYEENYSISLLEEYEQAGANVLEFMYNDIVVDGQQIRIGGLFGYCTPEKYLETNEADPEECAFLDEFQSTDHYTMLLTHMPYSWIANDAISEWDIDCVFTGHDHGGQIRIPLIGGLYAPDQGLFSGKDAGLYYSQDDEKVMILSRGLGSAGWIPRLNNIPEIVVVDIIPEP